jgi:hypothetical protein
LSTYNVNPGAGSDSPSSGYKGDFAPPRVAAPPRGTVEAPPQQNDPFNGPGSMNFDLTDPQGSVQQAAQETGDVFGGLKAFLFGTNTPDANNHRGGLFNVGDVPVVGDALRGTADVVGGAGGAVVGGAAALVGGIAERIPTGEQSTGSTSLQDQFNALPDDSEAKKAALKQMEADKGLFGTGLLSGQGHYMAAALQQHEEEVAAKNPSLWTGLFRPSASLADTVGNLFGFLGLGQRVTERLIAGAGRPGQDNLNQLQQVMMVGDGNATWNSDDPGLTAVEQTAYDNYKHGDWSETQALDYLASHGAGLAHNKALEIAGSIATDPLTVASVGAGVAAKFAETGLMLTKTLSEAKAGLSAAQAAGDAEKVAQYTKAVEAAQQGIRSGVRAEGVGSRDVLGQLATQKWTGSVARKYGQFYGSDAGVAIAKAAKIARSVVDPMSAISINPRSAAALDEGAASIVHSVVSAHGELTHIDNINALRALDGGEALADHYNEGLAIYAGNAFRRVAGRQFRSVQMMMADKGEGLVNTLPFESLKAAVSGMKKRGLTQLEEEAGKYVKEVWTAEEDGNLASRASVLWGGRTAADWEPDIAKMSGKQKSLLHAATYGSAVKQLHAARETVRLSGQTGTFANRLDDLVLLNRRTLTDLGHEGILTRLAAATTDEAKMAEIEAARETYPELRNFAMDWTSSRDTVDNFLEMMDRRKNFLPAQIREAERGSLPQALRDFDSTITPNADPAQAVFTLGFRPKPEFLWGMEADSDGVLREVHDPWFDQVSDNLREYSPVHEVPHNIAGVPIVGAVADKTAKALDFAEASARTAFHGVTGKMVSQAAHIKFVENVAAKYVAPDGTPLLQRGQAEAIWKALMTKVDDTESISGMRGLSQSAIWDAAKAVIPRSAENAGLDRRALLVHVLDAYNGDVRYIGLTQKLSGRVKMAASLGGRTNTAGMIAEHAWPLLKFRLNPFFQLQEKIEPWVLSAQRGASVILGTKANEIDHATAAIYRNFAEKNLINIADNDIAELSAKYAVGKALTDAGTQEGGVFNKAMSAFSGLADVQGSKQLAMMRTFRKGLGKTMRQAWDEVQPGEFDKMLDAERARQGVAIDEDTFAVLTAHSNLAANDIPVSMIDGKPTMDFSNAILEGQWAAPQHLGELRPLNLDYMARRIELRTTAGEDIKTSMDLRRALADGTISQRDVSRALRELGAHKDYIARVESAMSFSWNEFWHSAQESFTLSDPERVHLEGMFRKFARQRDMTPVEYMSQVYSPMIGRGTEAAVGSLGDLVGAVRNGLPTPDLATLRGVAGQSGIQDFYRQAGAIMAHHLDPSAKRAFLLDLLDQNGSGDIRRAATRHEILTDMQEIEAAFDSGATDALSDRIMNFLQGQPGTGPHTLVADERTGIESIRNLSSEVRARAGRPRNLQRTIHEDAPGVEQSLADALDQMPEEYHHVPTTEDLARVIDKDMVAYHARLITPSNFKNEDFLRLPDAARASYEARMLETRNLYNRITKPRAEGGLGIKVKYNDRPYASAAVLRADLARGEVKVPKTGYWHPLIQNEDLAMEEVVKRVFGHGQEANELGSHDAIMSAAAMYSDEARGTVLTDGFARDAWERKSAQVVPTPVAEPKTIAEYEARWGGAADRMEKVPTSGLAPGTTVSRLQTRTLGTNFRAAAPEVQAEILDHLGSLRNQFPSVELHAFDLGNIPANGMTLEFELEHPSIVLATDAGWQNDPAIRQARRDERAAIGMNTAGDTHIHNPTTGLDEPRQALPGVPMFTSDTPTGDLYHEFGHAVDIAVHKRARVAAATNYGSPRLTKFMREFKGSESQTMLSEYAFNLTKTHKTLRDSDMFAELFDMALNPEHDIADLYGTPLMDDVMEFRSILKDEGIWHPDGAPFAANPHAGMTIADANAAGAGIRAPFKLGTLPQDTLDEVTQHFIGSGRYAEANPDIGRMAAYLNSHMRDVTGYTLETGEASPYRHMFGAMSGMPVADAVPFNATEAAVWHGAAQMMAAKWEDAFRLQYFAQSRSMLQRSINHPMFGLYPASYMWGKIGPEMVRFIAAEPFGMRTAAMGYTMLDLQRAIAVQRQYDPEFDKGIEGVGHSAALGFLGYMLPATPWDIPASYPAWMRDAAQQGLANQRRADVGGTLKDNDFVTPLTDTLKKLVPMTTQLPFASRAAGDAGNLLPWNQHEAPAAPTFNPSGELPLAPAGNAPASAPASPQTGALPVGPVHATDLTAILVDPMRSLTDALSGV